MAVSGEAKINRRTPHAIQWATESQTGKVSLGTCKKSGTAGEKVLVSKVHISLRKAVAQPGLSSRPDPGVGGGAGGLPSRTQLAAGLTLQKEDDTARQSEFCELRPGRDQQVHAASDPVPVHRLNDVRVKRGSEDIEIKRLISVNKRHLRVCTEDPVVGALRRQLRGAEERSPVGLASVEVRERITAGRGESGFRREVLGRVYQTDVQD